MYRIAIIGAGQLGSRHLQAMAHLQIAVELFAVDPSEISLQTAQARWNEVGGLTKGVKFLDRIEQLPTAIDLAIIATGSAMRRLVIDQLTDYCAVRYMILEKFLFQQEKDFTEVSELLNRKKVL